MFHCEEFISVNASAFNPILGHCSSIYCVAKLWALLVKGGRPLAHSMSWALWPKLTPFPLSTATPQQSSSRGSKGSDWPAATALQYSSYLCEVGSRVLLLLHTMITLLSCVLWCLASKALWVTVGTHGGQTWCFHRLGTWPCLAIL